MVLNLDCRALSEVTGIIVGLKLHFSVANHPISYETGLIEKSADKKIPHCPLINPEPLKFLTLLHRYFCQDPGPACSAQTVPG